MRVLLVAAAALATPAVGRAACPSTAGCPVAAQTGAQPCTAEITRSLERAARHRLDAAGPSIGTLGSGCPNPVSVAASFPCILIKAIGWTESVWTQFCAAACGQSGPTMISFDCGYGVMQVTSGMSGGAGFDPLRVAQETLYNLGTGARILRDKWAVTPCVGANQPTVIEDWYFATWAYNGFSFVNNPNNPAYPSVRPPYNGLGSLSRGSYPYQEIVWGFMRNPPGARWVGVPVSYPERTEICSVSGCRQTANVSEPLPSHTDPCQTRPPMDAALLVSERPLNPIIVGAGRTTTKTWRVRNIGDTVWSATAGYAVVPTSGDDFGHGGAVPWPPGDVLGEDEVDLTVSLTAPPTPGPVSGTFRLARGGAPFGPDLVAQLNVATRVDADGDGHASPATGGDDCDDADPAAYPGAPERCDGVDQNCDRALDVGLVRPCATACGTGVESCGGAAWGGCSAREPSGEVCNGLDDDCNGASDDGDRCGPGQACEEGSCVARPASELVAPPKGGCGCGGRGAVSLAPAAAALVRRRRRFTPGARHG